MHCTTGIEIVTVLVSILFPPSIQQGLFVSYEHRLTSEFNNPTLLSLVAVQRNIVESHCLNRLPSFHQATRPRDQLYLGAVHLRMI